MPSNHASWVVRLKQGATDAARHRARAISGRGGRRSPDDEVGALRQTQTIRGFLVTIAIAIVSVASFTPSATAAVNDDLAVKLAWDANEDPTVVGYRVHLGVHPGRYFKTFDAGPETTWTLNLPLPSTTYYINATTYAGDGTESEFTDEIVHQTPVADFPFETVSRILTIQEDSSAVLESPGTTISPAVEWVVSQPPAHGELRFQENQLYYVPEPDFDRTDAFEVIAGLETGAPVKILWSIIMIRVEDPPRVRDLWVTTESDASLELELPGTDPEGLPLTFRYLTLPLQGTLEGTPPNVVYRPADGFVGLDSFEYVVDDGTTVSRTVTIHVDVTTPVTADRVRDQMLTSVENEPLEFDLNTVKPEELTFAITSPPRVGTLEGTPPHLIYRPPPGFSGTDTFTVEATDLKGQVDSAVISITVEPINDPPLAIPGFYETTPGNPVTITLEGIDPENDPLTFEIGDQPTKGTLIGDPPVVQYVPNPGELGPDSISYRTFDGNSFSGIEWITITVAHSSAPPVLRAEVSTNGLFRLRWSAIAGRTYQVLFRESLASTIWTPAGPPVVASSDSVEWIVESLSPNSMVFYAVELLPP
ncbi:MAG: Ig-like domain-containing protein [Limisphaerales bacterium]